MKLRLTRGGRDVASSTSAEQKMIRLANHIDSAHRTLDVFKLYTGPVFQPVSKTMHQILAISDVYHTHLFKQLLKEVTDGCY